MAISPQSWSRAEDPNAALSLYHLLDQEVLANPYPLFHRLRKEDPVHWDPFLHAWIVTRYTDVLEVLHTFSADRTPSPEQLTAMGLSRLNPIAQLMVKQMLFMDAPTHTRLRSLAAKAFTPARVEALRTHIQSIMDRLLDKIVGKGRMNVISELAEPLPAIVTAEMLGVPVADSTHLKTWSANFAEMLGNFQHNPDHTPLMLQTVEDMTTYFRDMVRQVKEQPRPGLIHSLLTTEIDGDHLTDEEVVANTIVTMVGGQETTTNLIGNGLLTLLRHPAEMARLREDLSLIPSAVEEMLRFESPSQHTARLAPSDRELGGKPIRKRQAVIAVMAAANRDPERFADPDRFDITRPDNRHLAFGYAAHFCFGAPLARIEAQIAFETLLRRLPDIRLEPQQLTWRSNLGLRGLTSLWVAFGDNGGENLKASEVRTANVESASATSSGKSVTGAEQQARSALLEKLLSGAVRQQHIPRRSASESIPLSDAQEQIWLHSEIAPTSPMYNEPVIIYRRGPLDAAVLERSLNAVISRHEAWRTNFDLASGRPVQIVHPVRQVNLPIVDLRNVPESEREAEARRLAAEQSKKPFDLRRDLLIRATLAQMGDEEFQVILTLHHIVFDGLSIYRVFLPELMVFYRAFSQGEEPSLPALPLQYGDFAVWQGKQLRENVLAPQMEYWRKHLEGRVPVLQLPTDHPRPAVQSFRGAMQLFQLPAELSESLREFSRRQGTTLFMTLEAAFATLLHRYSGQNDFIVGTVSAGRKQSELEGVMGCFQNPLALRMDLSGEPTFEEFLQRVKKVTLGALSHDDVPFSSLVKELHPDRVFSHNPLLQVLISLSPPVTLAEPGWDVTQMGIDVGVAKFDLDLELDDRPDGLRGRFVYNTDLFDASTITRMTKHWETLLAAIVNQPRQAVSAMPILTADEVRQLAEWNRTAADYPAKRCLHELVELQAEFRPAAIAAVQEKNALSYRELNGRANQLAHYLRKHGVGPDVPVGVCLGSSPELAVAMLGIMKAGGACVPLDPGYPEERLAYMLQDAQAPVLITREGMLPEGANGSAVIIDPIDQREAIERESDRNPQLLTTPESLAYIIYTSGSTGKPRGVLLTHRGLVNHNTAAIKLYGLTDKDRVLQFSSVSFDIAVEEMFPTWLSGGAVVFKTADMPLTAVDFLKWIQERHVSVLDLPTAFWHELVHQLSENRSPLPRNLRLLIVGGEKASPATFQAWRNLTQRHEPNHVRWINTYGPTETTVIATSYEPPADSTPAMLPIGKPIANVQIHILDSSLRPVPIGVRGELYIGGPGVARGYLNRPEMTEQKFIPDPFRSEPGARLYKTGDMARYLPSGDIEFLGRTDDQIKIRGFRVELGEIETVLSHHPGVHEPVVVAREDGRGEKILVAYYLATQQPAPTSTVLRSFLKDKLPEYMVPSAFLMLDAMPMTPNGKVDRRALPAPQQTDLTPAAGQFVATKDELELQLVKIWESVLGKSPIGVRQNFFDLGGHSLLAVRLMHRLEQVFGKKMPITTLFMAPTIEQLAELLRRDGWSPSWSSLVPIQPEGTKPPFFCIHGAGGTVIIYRDLAQQLGPDQPVYGLQAQGLDGSQQRLNSVEEMAEHYLRDMRTVQPQGPYFLGGLSFGGTVAFEIAQRLRAEGEEVGVLALFDTFAGKHESNRELLVKLWHLPFSEKVSYVAHKSKQYAKTLTRKLQHGFLPAALIKVREGIQQAGAQYTLTPYEGPVVLFRASRKSLRGTHDPYSGWRELALGGLEIHEIPGDHVGIVLEPQVRILAKHLRNCLERAQAQREITNAQEQLCTR